ncbi:MAG: ATP-binding protein [Sedimentisphaerales bacterium]|nr:ATP-binding protein [Sedimentisphaerales bacterium]
MADSLPTFEMRFEPMTIEHLGLRLYSTLPPVISEFVSNAYDAEAPKVEVSLPTAKITRDTEIVIRDFGHGMTAIELSDEFLPIGRNRRGKDSKHVMSKNKRRRVTGRKGLGKLSAFGVATEMDVRSIKKGKAICLRLNYDDMQSWIDKYEAKTPYRPTVVKNRTGETNEPDGVEITLRKLHRKSPISDEDIRRGLAKRLAFIGKGFGVFVNGYEVQPEDRLSMDECEYAWEVAKLPGSGSVGTKNKLSGWIGFLEKSSQKGRGIDIYATGKAVEIGSFFNYPSTHAQFARAHLVGQIHADFLDAPGKSGDRVATARNSVVWETSEGQALEKWGHSTLKWAFDKWLEARRKKREEAVTVETGFDEWLKGRQPRERKVAQRMVKLLVENDDLEAVSAKPLLEIVKSSVETVAFRDLVEAIETEGGTPTTLLKLFGEWKIIEAREHLKLAYGRLEALDQLERFINEGALEVKEMQPLLATNPWIIDPAWTETQIEQTYTSLLKKHATEPKDTPEKDRRIDIWGVRSGTGVTVVELKHPKKRLTWADLDQIENYVFWARENIVGTGGHAPRYADGLLVVGDLTNDGKTRQKMEHLAGLDIRVETFRDLYIAARGFYDELDRRLQTIAPEYSRLMKKEREATKGKHTKPSKKKSSRRRK